MRGRWAIAFALGCGCGSSSTDPAAQSELPPRIRDAGVIIEDAAPTDSGRRTIFPESEDASTTVGDCDPTKPFGTPTLLLDANTKSATPRLSHDELTVYFTSDGAMTSTDLFRATRASRSSAFGAPDPMTAQSSPSNDNDPAPTADHLSVFFHSGRSGNNELWVATRASTAVDFGAPMLVPNVNDPTAGDSHPYYRSAGGGELYFTSLRGGATTYRLHRAKKNVAGFVTPTEITELSGAWNDWQPMVTEDGLTMLFASDRPAGDSMFHLFMANRASDADPWGTPQKITELASTTGATEYAGWLSADRCRIYFSTGAGSNLHRVYFASRPL